MKLRNKIAAIATVLTSMAMALMYAAPAQPQYVLTPDQKLRLAEGVIENYYVESVNPDSIVDQAIIAMLKTLDPHSAYTTPEETRELNQPLEGKFSGIGIQFNMVKDTLYVVQTTPGGPCEKVGVRPGDRIISANDTIISGKKLTNSGIIKVLRGPKGSVVELKVKRGDEPELLSFTIVRDDIPIYSISDTYMANDTTGYIAISRFAESTAEEMVKAVNKLLKKGMRNLIIDISDNTGGYLGAACALSEGFLAKGDPVVSTQGLNSPRASYTVEADGKFKGRVVVIVNQYSASAAEILAGALQDNDRAVIVGRRTFGKGLVQRPFPFPDGSMIRLTTSRYYTPSGRCIQKHYDKGHSEEYQLDLYNRYTGGELWSADSVKLDSTQRFETLRHHRVIYGGGGIMPDVFVPVDTTHFSKYYRDLIAKRVIIEYCLDYVNTNRKELLKKYRDDDAFHTKFAVTDELLQSLIDRGIAEGVAFVEDDWQRSRRYIAAIVKGLLSRDLYDNGSYARAVAPINPDMQAALSVINDPERYNGILRGTGK